MRHFMYILHGEIRSIAEVAGGREGRVGGWIDGGKKQWNKPWAGTVGVKYKSLCTIKVACRLRMNKHFTSNDSRDLKKD